jgi:hypothetical protein
VGPGVEATEVVRKVVIRVISKLITRLIRKVISTCTRSRTTLLMRQLMSFRARKPLDLRGTAGHPAPADEGDDRSDTGPDPSLPTTWMEGSGPV